MSSQRISEFFDSISEEERNAFYRDWMKLLPSVEYLALDITSISSYSELMGNIEWGYNRDGEKLAQVNLCMLFGEESELLCFQIAYSGSVADVSTLLTTVDELRALLPGKRFRLVMDKGFYSEPNVQTLLDQKPAIEFIVAAPFSADFARKQVDLVRSQIDGISHAVVTAGETVRGIHKVRSWGPKREKLHVYVFHNPETALRARNNLYRFVKELEAVAHAHPKSRKWRKAFDRYLIIRKSRMSPSGVTVTIREDVIEEELKYSGWLVLVSTLIFTPAQALEIYRRKDVVEKSFDRLKRGFCMRRLRVHSDERAENKLFVGFIAQILISSLSRRMREANLFRQYSISKVLHVLSRIKVGHVGERMYRRPLTAEQRQLTENLGVSEL